MFIEIIKTIILGIIEGFTEFLPISSTGHLYLADEFVKLNESPAFIHMFMVVIQFGAILAVILIYFHKLNPFSPKKNKVEKNQTWKIWLKVLIAILPSVVIGLPLNDWMDAHLTSWQVISATLLIYGILFIVVENYFKNKTPQVTDLDSLSYKTALGIGLFQVLSLVPGTSRSGATILGGISIGTSRFVATEFSFFLAIPTMFGASLLKIGKYFHNGNTFTGDQTIILLVGTFVSFVVAYASIKFLLNYIKKNDFKAFGWYRIILAIIVIIYFGLLKQA
ncbi:undecaprenyl-diphosphate phosphatase [Companilactobacillus mishanensis]|uniref:Undecaprenyl-diphosphatase n=1 Tax=Companilactobacillus mishanensis TaxID=2486008 RepID=A0A5P0ZFV0_9LACO|nr:undecaprenyl-diphosphate phosphatase [Companilactobacillus mishanensis]MQS45632.1 undecaprenyl-diphosphate phosphatase [Companilactobacillus mishanensis]MQS51879.1 undecaprenyl-diphosphate phosphatase [Companilactobacillus mishanensis]MQS89006.1 undecaprenyl-diphosphate phosphatase [Companilactobacillus mishanensis]